ncbi:MAG: RNA-binding domain-containing protein [Candidatus Bathyarchaeia archaeon]
MSELEIRVEVSLLPTEDEEKVRLAVSNIFPKLKFGVIKISDVQGRLVGTSHDLEGLSRFKELLSRERIRAAAWSVLASSVHENYLTIHLNKQTAYAGHLSFATEPGESVLGPITVHIRSDDPRKIIEWLVEAN